jgi:hypothetical protein
MEELKEHPENGSKTLNVIKDLGSITYKAAMWTLLIKYGGALLGDNIPLDVSIAGGAFASTATYVYNNN